MAITRRESTLGFDPLDRPIWGVAAIADAKARGLELY